VLVQNTANQVADEVMERFELPDPHYAAEARSDSVVRSSTSRELGALRRSLDQGTTTISSIWMLLFRL
jgi:hypothetical protein